MAKKNKGVEETENINKECRRCVARRIDSEIRLNRLAEGFSYLYQRDHVKSIILGAILFMYIMQYLILPVIKWIFK